MDIAPSGGALLLCVDDDGRAGVEVAAGGRPIVIWRKKLFSESHSTFGLPDSCVFRGGSYGD